MCEFHNFEEIDRDYFYGGELGAIYSSQQTIFRVWSPIADQVSLKLYSAGDGTGRCQEFPMKRDRAKGIWEICVPGDLDGVYYTYTVEICGRSRETIDVYAKAAGVNGQRGMVLALGRTDPEGFRECKRAELKSPCDAVLYELHVRDFSADPKAGFVHRGKYLAFTEENVHNSFGEVIGLEHIKDLGITHIHLLPVADFQSVDEAKEFWNYNWGYDPMNFNVPEGSYSTDPFDGSVRVKEFKQLVMAAHRKGLGIVMDVVYNHTYEADDSAFSKIFPGYYYRHTKDGHANGSGCGNEFASERKMASKYIVDSVCYLAEEYMLDGFRFDLMGLLDIETMNECARRLRQINPDILLYGEGWTCSDSPLDENLRALKKNAGKLDKIAMFSDDFRDGVKGSVFLDKDCGFINGGSQKMTEEKLQSLLCGGISLCGETDCRSEHWAKSPAQSMNYVEAHDNLTFHDKLCLSMPGADEEEIKNVDKLGAALIFLSQGIPFIQAGQEFLKSKPLPGGGFDHDSYASPDEVNCLKWDDLHRYHDLAEYYRGLIRIRKKFPVFRMNDPDRIRKSVRFIKLKNNAAALYLADFVLIINPSKEEISVNLTGEVFADKMHAADLPVGRVEGEGVCEAQSILLVRQDAGKDDFNKTVHLRHL